MKSLSPNDFFDFICAYFGARIAEPRRESSHFVVRITGIDDNISIPTNIDPIPIRILNSLLKSCGINKKEFTELAGNKKKLSIYLKKQRKLGKQRNQASEKERASDLLPNLRSLRSMTGWLRREKCTGRRLILQ